MNGPGNSNPPDNALGTVRRSRKPSAKALSAGKQGTATGKVAAVTAPSKSASNSLPTDVEVSLGDKTKGKGRKNNNTTGGARVTTASKRGKTTNATDIVATAATTAISVPAIGTESSNTKGAARVTTAGATKLVEATTMTTRTAIAVPAAPPLLQCDWARRPGSRVCFGVFHNNLDTCNKPGCNVRFHHGCQTQWEYNNDAEADGCAKLCRLHHPYYFDKMNTTTTTTTSRAIATDTTTTARANSTVTTTTPRANHNATFYFGTPRENPNATAGHPPPFPPTTIVNNTTAMESPAISELTGGGISAAPLLHVPNLPAFNPSNLVGIEEQDNEDDTSKVAEDDDDSNISVQDDDSSYAGDSDDEGDEAKYHTQVVESDEESEDDGMDDDEFDNDADGSNTDGITVLKGSPPGWFPPQPPPEFEYVPKFGAPAEEEIDNPGHWPMYAFGPRYSTKKEYTGHFTPTGAQVVPEEDNGERIVNGWKFHYNGWQPDEFDDDTYVRIGASRDELKPQSRKGCLDVDVLTKHGLTSSRVAEDPLFFLQMLLPIMSPSDSGVDGDHRMPYYSNAAVLTNMYASSKGVGIGIGHEWKPCTIKDMVRWSAVPIRHGALEGSPGTLKYRWVKKDDRFRDEFNNSITYSRYLEIKRYFKLNFNHEEAKRGTPEYDPCAKYDYIVKTLIHNMNYCTAAADLDQTIDESTWPFAGYSGEAGGRLINKPVSKGAFLPVVVVHVVQCYAYSMC